MRKFVTTATIAAASLVLASCGGETASEDVDVEGATSASAQPQPTFAELTGDPAAGERAYGKCRACHLLEEGRVLVGPSLYGIVGRQAGSVPGFAYSEANASADFTWTGEVLFEYLENPREQMPGTRMVFPGIADAQERADIVAFLETQGD